MAVKVLARFISHKANQWLLENQQMLSIVLMALVFTGSLRVLAIPVIFIYQHLIGFSQFGEYVCNLIAECVLHCRAHLSATDKNLATFV